MQLQISDKDEASEKLNKTINKNKKKEIFVKENVFRQQQQKCHREWKRKRKSFFCQNKIVCVIK